MESICDFSPTEQSKTPWHVICGYGISHVPRVFYRIPTTAQLHAKLSTSATLSYARARQTVPSIPSLTVATPSRDQCTSNAWRIGWVIVCLSRCPSSLRKKSNAMHATCTTRYPFEGKGPAVLVTCPIIGHILLIPELILRSMVVKVNNLADDWPRYGTYLNIPL
jgi:hypothetical protein